MYGRAWVYITCVVAYKYSKWLVCLYYLASFTNASIVVVVKIVVAVVVVRNNTNNNNNNNRSGY